MVTQRLDICYLCQIKYSQQRSPRSHVPAARPKVQDLRAPAPPPRHIQLRHRPLPPLPPGKPPAPRQVPLARCPPPTAALETDPSPPPATHLRCIRCRPRTAHADARPDVRRRAAAGIAALPAVRRDKHRNHAQRRRRVHECRPPARTARARQTPPQE